LIKKKIEQVDSIFLFFNLNLRHNP